jgi:hypothetical protein
MPPASAPAVYPASQPTSQPAPWIPERCRGPLPRPAGASPATLPAAPPLDAVESAALKERGLLLEPVRLRHFVVGRGGHIELHRKPAPNGRGNGGKGKTTGMGNGARNGTAGPGVVCVPIAEVDLLPLPGCERLHLCVEEGAHALVVEAEGRPVLARGAALGVGAFTVRVVPAPEAGEQIVWQATERGLDPTHEVVREEVLRPKGPGLRQVFGRVLVSSVGEVGAAGVRPTSWPTACVVEPLLVRCGDERYTWDADAFEYRLTVPAGLVPYQPQRVKTGSADPVRAFYAALRAATKVGVALQRGGFECVEAQIAYELWSRWPVREGRAPGPGSVWRAAVGPGLTTVAILPYVAEDDGQPRVGGVRPDHAYRRERAFLLALLEALDRPVDGPPTGLEGFRCASGFGQPIADVSLGAALDKVRSRERRWRRRCDKTLVQARRAAAAAGGRVRLTCEARDRTVRTYDFANGSLVTVAERYPADFGVRHFRRAVERWTARFGEPTAVGRPPGVNVKGPPAGGLPGAGGSSDAGGAVPLAEVQRWRWHDRELSAVRQPDGAAVFEHRLVPAAASQPALPRPAAAASQPALPRPAAAASQPAKPRPR